METPVLCSITFSRWVAAAVALAAPLRVAAVPDRKTDDKKAALKSAAFLFL
jgi:hypothetical protein